MKTKLHKIVTTLDCHELTKKQMNKLNGGEDNKTKTEIVFDVNGPYIKTKEKK